MGSVWEPWRSMQRTSWKRPLERGTLSKAGIPHHMRAGPRLLMPLDLTALFAGPSYNLLSEKSLQESEAGVWWTLGQRHSEERVGTVQGCS